MDEGYVWRPYTRDVHGEVTLYDAVGGMPFFEALVDRFYDGVRPIPSCSRCTRSPRIWDRRGTS